MKNTILLKIPNLDNIILELDAAIAPKTVNLFIKSLPFKVGINTWGEELYTDPTPIKANLENAKSVVDLFDVAYWPPGNAICLFFGPTPLAKNEIKPYSPVNVIGKITNPDKKILSKIQDGVKVTLEKL